MPIAPLKPCAKVMCREFCKVGESYCEVHRVEHIKARELYSADEIKFYKSSLWRKLRNWFISHNPLCVKCGADARVIDHIKPIKQGGSRLDISNLQSLCDRCHNEKRSRESRTGFYLR